MTREYLADVAVDRPEKFEEALSELVVAALAEGVDVRGSWLCRVDGSYAWEADLVELASEAGVSPEGVAEGVDEAE